MPKLKVGDRVKVVANDSSWIGLEGEISEVNPHDTWEYYVTLDTSIWQWGFNKDELEKLR